ncbi:hypothetical protein [Chitinivibrio alkaliphilus]|uniref:Uncharacterized protein n=1 Tax=Chitinivibrio alkaliphilus ACht1 TaxID=1313304 RepID=U7D5Z9_9BACT|nr:hypothetical protein [Chitinivibrio alkaliphilus]ERP31358.1 hypothetical protein CALK_1703 [Chitinivibrio alkaliphilus ACht1]
MKSALAVFCVAMHLYATPLLLLVGSSRPGGDIHTAEINRGLRNIFDMSSEVTLLSEHSSSLLKRQFYHNGKFRMDEGLFSFTRQEIQNEGYILLAVVEEFSLEPTRRIAFSPVVRHEGVYSIRYVLYDIAVGKPVFATTVTSSVSEVSRILLPWKDATYRARPSAQQRQQYHTEMVRENLHQAEQLLVPRLEL